MRASAEKSAATRSDDPMLFLRPQLPVWTQVNVRTTSRDPSCVAGLGQKSGSHLPLHASKAEGHRRPHPDHLPEPCGNREVPSRDSPEPKRSWLPPTRRGGSWGPLPLPVPRFVPPRGCATLPDRLQTNPASSATHKD